METLIISLQTIGAFSGAIAGFTQGQTVEQYLNRSIIAKYKNRLDFKPNKIFNESFICKLMGASAGLLIGYYAWPITLPISLALIEIALFPKPSGIIPNWL